MASNVNIIITGNSAQAKAAIEQVNKSLGKTDDAAKKTSATMDKLKTVGKVAAAALAAAAVALAVKSVQAASNLEEVTAKFETVFGDAADQADDWAKVLVDSYAMSTREARQYLSSVQDLLVPMGMAADSAAEMSNEVVKLSADLGSFNNMPTERVMADMQSALVGNFETMKKYGVVLNATLVQQKAINMGLVKTKDELTAAEKAQAAYALILEGTRAAQGDMIRTQDSYANQVKFMKAAMEDFSAALGAVFIPAIKPVVEWLTKALRALAGMMNAFKDAQNEMKRSREALKQYGIESAKQIRAVEGLANAYEKWKQAGSDIAFIKRLRSEMQAQGKDFDTLANQNTEWGNRIRSTWNNAKEDLKEYGGEMAAYKKILKDTDITTGSQALEVWGERNKIINENTEATTQNGMVKLQEAVKQQKALAALVKAEEAAKKKQAKLEKQAFDVRKNYWDAGISALVSAAADEEATVKGVAATVIMSLAKAYSARMTVRAIAAAASYNYGAAAKYTGAAIAILAAGGVASRAIKKMQGGGVIEEPVVGVGLKSGASYSFGEAGPETVSPGAAGEAAEAQPGNLVIEKLEINYPMPIEDVMEGLNNYADRMGLTLFMRRKE